MGGSWIHKIASSQLLNVAKTLELRSVNDLHQKWMQSDVAMNRVVEHFLHVVTIFSVEYLFGILPPRALYNVSLE